VIQFGGNPDHASDPGVQSPKSGSFGLLKKLQTDLCHAVFGGGLCSLSASSYINCKVHMPCDLNFVKGEGLLKVTGSYVHWKKGNISESKTVLDRDVVTTSH